MRVTDLNEKEPEKRSPAALGRRATDHVTTDGALELICSLAYEYALKNPSINREAVETAITKCRELKVEQTGVFKKLP